MENATTANPYNLDLGNINAMGSGDLTVKTTQLWTGSTPMRGLGTTTNLSADPGIPNNIVLNTNAVLNLGRGSNARFEGVISGATGQVSKRNTSTVILDGANTYGGGTRVDNGTLTINGSLADATMTILGGTVNGSGTLTFKIDGSTTDQIAMTGGTLNTTALNVAINPMGAGLTEAEYILVNATAGTLAGNFASLSGAPGYSLNYDTPGQVKLVQTGSSATYATWSGGLAPNIDSNGDGVENAAAWVLGAADPSQNSLGLLPSLGSMADPDFLIFNYRRSDDALADSNTAMKVQYGSSLTGWTDATASADVVITSFDDFYGVGVDKVEVKIRRSLASGQKLFARLHVTVTSL
jgi:autotransporter-associated beta strand protein